MNILITLYVRHVERNLIVSMSLQFMWIKNIDTNKANLFETAEIVQSILSVSMWSLIIARHCISNSLVLC
jgi:hypothetical protein